MTLTDEQHHQLEDLQEKATLKDSRAWQLFRRDHVEKAIAAIEHQLLSKKMSSHEAYLELWERRQALQAILNTLDTTIPTLIKQLTDRADAEPDDGPATGALA